MTQVERLAQALLQRGWMLATAESCTGGMIAARCTDLAGSSQWFERGFITYSNEAKHESLGVSQDILTQHGAVSEEAVRAMALGALRSGLASWNATATARSPSARFGGVSTAKTGTSVTPSWRIAAETASWTWRWMVRIMGRNRRRDARDRLQAVRLCREVAQVFGRVHVDEAPGGAMHAAQFVLANVVDGDAG